MRKKLLSTLLALALCLGLLPITAYAAEEPLPDWYFLFAIFKNVDTDCQDRDGNVTHLTDSMPQDEIDGIRDDAQEFEDYMNSLGVIRAHVEVVEIDAPVTELYHRENNSSYLTAELAAPLLETKVDLDRYDHVTCILNLNTWTGWAGITSNPFANGTGISNCNFMTGENYQKSVLKLAEQNVWGLQLYVHEFLHFMEHMDRKWGVEFVAHREGKTTYTREGNDWEIYYTDALLNRLADEEVFPEGGTGVHPIVWQYPPHALRTMTELAIPSGITSIGTFAFDGRSSLTRLTIPSSVTSIGKCAFRNTGLTELTIPSTVTTIEKDTFAGCADLSKVTIQPGITTIEISLFAACTSLTELTIPSSVTSIQGWAFQYCDALTRVSIPASVTSIKDHAFYKSGLTDVYYGGTEEQWKAIEIGDYNSPLTNAAIHYNSLMADVKTTDWFADPVAWALENGIAGGTGGYKFSPKDTCTQGQILTFLWRAKGEPVPEGAVSGKEYYAGAVQWAREQGLVGDDLSPDANCTRADVVTYLWKLADSPAAGSADFSDVPAGADYAQAVAWAVAQEITGGTGSGQFSPDGACTRGEIVTFLYRALK